MPEEQRTAVFEAKKKQSQDERVAYWKENQLVPPCKESERGSITGEPQGIEAKAAAIVDRCGNVLWSKNGQEKMQVASTTKVPTMLVAAHYGNKNDKITYSKHASAIVGSGGDRAVGYTNGLDDELHKMISESNNKTTVAVGAHIGGIIDPEAKTEYQKLVAFMKEMNEMVKKVGAVNSYFINPNGLGGGGQATEETTNAGSGTYIDYLPDSPAYDEWYSTAEDLTDYMTGGSITVAPLAEEIDDGYDAFKKADGTYVVLPVPTTGTYNKTLEYGDSYTMEGLAPGFEEFYEENTTDTNVAYVVLPVITGVDLGDSTTTMTLHGVKSDYVNTYNISVVENPVEETTTVVATQEGSADAPNTGVATSSDSSVKSNNALMAAMAAGVTTMAGAFVVLKKRTRK